MSSVVAGGLLASTSVLPALALTPPPPTTVINQPPVAPAAGAILSVFPSRDFVTTIGYPALTTGSYTINVLRNGVNVASAVTANPDLGINHPGGVCWDGVTPDIRPGDVVRITDPNGVANQTTVQALSIGAPTTDAQGNLVVHGSAASAGGNPVAIGSPLPPSQVEARILAPKKTSFSPGGSSSNGRDIRAGGAGGKQGTLTFDLVDPATNPAGTNWTAVYKTVANGGVLQPSDVTLAEDPGAQPVAIWLGTGGLTESTNTELIGAGRGILPGPQAPCTAPLAKGPSTPDMTAASDSGVSNTDNITNATTPTFTGVPGSVGAGATINLYDADPATPATTTLIGTTTVSAAGTYSVTPSAALAPGGHLISAGEVDPASGVETRSSGALSITIDTTAPAAPPTPTLAPGSDTGASATDNITNATLPTIDGTAEAGATVSVLVDGVVRSSGTADAAGKYSIPLTGTPLTNGVHTITAQATDVAGNTGPATDPLAALSVTIRTTPPAVPVLGIKPVNPTNDSTPSFSFTSDAGVTFECSLSTGADAFGACPTLTTNPDGSLTTTYGVQTDGGYTFKVSATDVAGNTSVSAPYAFTIDTVAPVATISTKPASSTNDNTPTFDFSSDVGSSFQCSLSTGADAFSACTSPLTYPVQADGAYTFKVVATDAAGNVGTPTSYPFTIDTVAPTVTVLTVSPASDTTPSFSFAASEKGTTTTCYLAQASLAFNAAALVPCTSPVTYGVVADGTYTFRVQATDAAGNVGPVTSQALTVTTTAPAPAIPATPTGLTATAASASQINLSWAASTGASGYHVYRDGAATAIATVTAGTTFSNTGLAASSTHSYTVDAFNASGTSAKSASVSATTQAAPPPATGGLSAPGVPARKAGTGAVTAAGAVPVTISWTKPTTLPTGTSTLSYAVETSTNGGAFTLSKTVTTLSTTLNLLPGTTYQVRVKATAKNTAGAALGTSAYATGTAFKPAAVQESSTAIAYTGTWTAQAVTGSYGGSVKFATAPAATTTGPSATYTFTGTSISWITTKGADRGKASVSIDGGTPVTVDLYAATTAAGRAVWTKSGLTVGTHKLTIKLLGTHNAAAAATSPNRVDIDGFEVLP